MESWLKIISLPHYTIYYANHPDGRAHTGSAIIIKSTTEHYELEPFIMNKIQCTILQHSISAEEYEHFLSQLGTYYLVASDWNAKNTAWGSNDCQRKKHVTNHTTK
jgi:hypothetical protein